MSSTLNTPNWTVGQKLYGYFALARISNSPTVASNVLAGAALAGMTQLNSLTVLLMVAMVGFYTAGMYLNDLCDFEIDCRQRPERPLPSGLITRSNAAIVTMLLFAGGSLILLASSLKLFTAGVLLIALIAIYDNWHKTNPISPLVMASTRFMVYAIAYLAFADSFSTTFFVASGLLVLYIVSLTFIAKSESGKQITRYWPVAVLLLPTVYFGVQLLPNPPMLILPAAFAAWVIYSSSFVYKHRKIGGAVARLIAGISLFDALVLATAGSTTGVLLALAAFALTLFFQRYIRGT